jgi:hypothetical protein
VQVEQPQPDAIAKAEGYTLLHRKRAALIRRLGRMPDRIKIGRLPPEVVHAIVTATTPILRALDATQALPAAVAA